MSAAAPLLSASASVLVFPAPFDKQQSQPLRLVNLSAVQAVAFKVRTNTRDRFAVRPNSGLLPPNGSVDLSIILHGSAEHDATINAMREKNQQKDRFLVVGVPCDPSKVSGADSLAQIIVAESNPSKLKLKVRYTFDNAKPVAADAAASMPSAAPAVSPSPVTSLPSPAPSPAPKAVEPSSARPVTAAARNASPARAKPAAAAAPAVVQASRPPPLTVSQLQTQVLRAKAGEEFLAEAPQPAGAKQTNQEKYLSSFSRDSAFLAAESSMSNQERFVALFEERRKLQAKLDDLAAKYREVVQERDKLSGIVRESKHRQSLSQPQRADANSMSVFVILLVAILAYIIGRWRS